MWNIVKINSEFHALKVTERDGIFEFFLSNLKNTWKKKFAENEIVSIIRECNPHIEATPTVLVKEAISSLEGSSGSEGLRCLVNSSDIILKPEFTIGGFPFKFDLKLNQMQDESIYQEITLPLVIMLQEMKEREEELIEIIRKKEDEIEDYRVGGAKLSNKMWKTKKFDKKMFCDGHRKSKNWEAILQNPASILLNFSSLFDSVSKNIVESKIFDGESIDSTPANLSQHSPDLFDESMEPEAKIMAPMKVKPKLSTVELKPKNLNHKKKSMNRKKFNL